MPPLPSPSPATMAPKSVPATTEGGEVGIPFRWRAMVLTMVTTETKMVRRAARKETRVMVEE